MIRPLHRCDKKESRYLSVVTLVIAVLAATPTATTFAADSSTEVTHAKTQPAKTKKSPYKGRFYLMRDNHDKSVGKDQNLCGDFTRDLNEFRRIDFNECNPQLSPKHPEFSRPAWEEIPFDEQIIKRQIYSRWVPPQTPENEAQAEKRWQMWLDETAEYRKAGKARMWRLRIDIDGDGLEDTLIRSTPGWQGDMVGVGKPVPPYGCDYIPGSFFVSDTANRDVAMEFPSGGITELIQYAKDNRYYSVEWNPFNASTLGGGGQGAGETPDIGGTATVDIEEVRWNGYGVTNGLECRIHWVPTGRYHPPVYAKVPAYKWRHHIR